MTNHKFLDSAAITCNTMITAENFQVATDYPSLYPQTNLLTSELKK